MYAKSWQLALFFFWNYIYSFSCLWWKHSKWWIFPCKTLKTCKWMSKIWASFLMNHLVVSLTKVLFAYICLVATCFGNLEVNLFFLVPLVSSCLICGPGTLDSLMVITNLVLSFLFLDYFWQHSDFCAIFWFEVWYWCSNQRVTNAGGSKQVVGFFSS